MSYLQKKLKVLLILIFWSPIVAHGNGQPYQSVGLSLSTLGPSIEYSYHLDESHAIRVIGSYFQRDKSVVTDLIDNDIDFKAHLKLNTVGLISDHYIRQSSFRLSSGLFYNRNRVHLKATPVNNVVLFGETYTPSELGDIIGTLHFMRLSPYLGVGMDKPFKQLGKRWGYSVDLGVVFQGPPQAKIWFNGSLADLNNQTSDQFVRDLEKNIELELDYNFVKYYPFAKFAINYRL